MKIEKTKWRVVYWGMVIMDEKCQDRTASQELVTLNQALRPAGTAKDARPLSVVAAIIAKNNVPHRRYQFY
jgi:hypothetical protein